MYSKIKGNLNSIFIYVYLLVGIILFCLNITNLFGGLSGTTHMDIQSLDLKVVPIIFIILLFWFIIIGLPIIGMLSKNERNKLLVMLILGLSYIIFFLIFTPDYNLIGIRYNIFNASILLLNIITISYSLKNLYRQKI